MNNYVIPHQFPGEPAATSTNGFTFGRKYRIVDRCNATVTVKNDNEHTRVLIPSTNSPHLIFQWGGVLGYPAQKCVGYFTEYNE